MVPPKFVRQIEQGCLRALKAQVRSERLEQWKNYKYESALTEPQQLADGGRSDPALRNAIKPALSLQSCVMLTNLRNDNISA